MTDEKRNDRHINFAANLILAYRGEEPFHLYLKKYFRGHQKHGSRDRKNITAYCYGYFRLGNGIIKPMSMEEKILLGDAITHHNGTLEERLSAHAHHFDALSIFPFQNQLSSAIEAAAFNKSFLVQPLLFLRLRPGNGQDVRAILSAHQIPYDNVSETCIAVANSTGLESVLKMNLQAVVQDLSSQNTSLFFKRFEVTETGPFRIWDACAASGGKSILAADHFLNLSLTVSDKRKSILENLKKRFFQAGIESYHLLKADLSRPVEAAIAGEPFGLIIADVPCSGSGTWSRTPEQLHAFKEDQIEPYASLQRSIVSNSLPRLKQNGHLLYITCSVFARENEENIKQLCAEHDLRLIHQEYITGYNRRADTLFGALLSRE